MNVKRILEEMAQGDMPPSRLDPAAAYQSGLRLRRVRKTRQRLAAAFGVVAVMAVLAIAHAMTSPRVPVVPGSPSPATAKASPTAAATKSPAVSSPPTTPPAERVAHPPALDCSGVAPLVRETLRAHGFRQEMTTTCHGLRLLATIELATSPMRITLTIEVSVHLPSDVAALSCSGRPGVCEEPSSAKLARGDGMLIAVRIATSGTGYGASNGTGQEDLRSLVLDLDAAF